MEAKFSEHPAENKPKKLDGSEYPVVQQLLDVVATIIAEEYVQTARKDPEVLTRVLN